VGSADHEGLRNFHHQGKIRQFSGVLWTLCSDEIPAELHARRLAHALDQEYLLMRCHENMIHPLSCEKILSVFKISRSSSVADSYRCSLRISALAASKSLGPI